MITSIQDARKIYEQRIGSRDTYAKQKAEKEQELVLANQKYENVIKARAVVQAVAKETQQSIEIHISNLVTMALASVFPEPYEFKLEFVERRNSTEADRVFLKNDNRIDDILNFGGGGVADVANFALIISLWALKKTRPIFINDEPDKFLHNIAYQERASAMMKMLCEKLSIQMIIVSDQQNIIAAADKVIRIGCKDGISFVEE
jgi:hypothetical protein